ncbi:arginase family protein [Roseobacter weihaiensis]|uniref:arginase family protein n=1 Tax=Roseobacter weihaiensis TaxID=2763262 RepID=UPI001D09D6FD|nr:arginase family protein [Roseobacter sp. H9]
MDIVKLIANQRGGNPETDALDILEGYLPFAGLSTFMKAPYTRDVQPGDIVVMGVPFDAGVTNRPGTRYGPRAIREQSYYATEFPPVYPWTTMLGDRHRIIDFGDVTPFPGTGVMDMILELTEQVSTEINAAGARILTLGGDHTLPIGLVRGVAKTHGPVALVHLDSHQDSYDVRDESGARMYNHGVFATALVEDGQVDPARSTQAYIRTSQPLSPKGGYDIVHANDALDMTPEALAERIKARIDGAPVYLTLDIDALDPSCAPGTGTPVPGGPTTADVRRLLKALEGINLVGADLVEVNPLFDPTGMTSVAAAYLAADLCHLLDASF